MSSLDSHGSRRITHRLYGKLGESNCQKPTLKRLSSILLKMDKGGKRSKKKKMNFERNYCNKVHQKRTEQEPNRPFLKRRRRSLHSPTYSARPPHGQRGIRVESAYWSWNFFCHYCHSNFESAS